MATEENGFKITDLRALKQMDDEDLFLVSDFESKDQNGNYHTRNLSVGQLMRSIADNKTLSGAIVNGNTAIGNAVDYKVKNAISTAISAVDAGGAADWN